MIDTGSTISAINAAYMRKINLRARIHPTTTSCRTANNGQLNVSGMMILPITINNIQMDVTTFIIEELCTDVLLGGDFCDKYNVNISYGEKYLTIKTKHLRTGVKFLQHTNTQQVFNVKAMNNIVIPPLSSKIVHATTPSPPMSAIFTPSSTSIKTIPKGTNFGFEHFHSNEE
ncbi:unnamed protein product [Didymodactylos carnosus]|uniref:Retropepsins domain-containing protein n=1 Tax=Didymodactylos carnosus TaxID=1234261 RepID=A0A8S2GFB1_9BILA|nr:unnamed protein product [Didymodactylos carnosus]CAF3511648.1 unnamed protein product [Didymodactylos carnosus]